MMPHTWQDIKQYLMPCLMGTEWNDFEQKNIPYIPFVGTMRITFVLRCNAQLGIQVNKNMLAQWNQTSEALERIARAHTEQEGYIVKRLGDALDRSHMYLISNPMMLFGAAVLISKQIRIQLIQEFRQDMFVLPASIHEVLAIPADTSADIIQLKNMIHSVNRSADRSNRLSDELYLLRKDDAVLIKISK